MKTTMKKFRSAITAVILQQLLSLTLTLYGTTAMAIEEPAYSIIESNDKIEYRQYQPFIIAETLIKDARDRGDASSVGFRRLFGYISGDNTAQKKIEMTAPVIQTDSKPRGEKIEMTAPVQQTETEEGWLVAFVLPLSYTIDTAPIPTNPKVQLRLIEPRTMAVICFSGRWTEKNVRRHEKELMEFLEEEKDIIIGKTEFAAYNAPFVLPFMRRNEVMVEVLTEK
jgi:hypothetical protein